MASSPWFQTSNTLFPVSSVVQVELLSVPDGAPRGVVVLTNGPHAILSPEELHAFLEQLRATRDVVHLSGDDPQCNRRELTGPPPPPPPPESYVRM